MSFEPREGARDPRVRERPATASSPPPDRLARVARLVVARAGAVLLAAAGGLAQARTTPEEAQRALAAGNRRFVAGQSLAQPLGEGTRRTLAHGQSPWAIVVTSSDSRVVPEHVFNVGLGDLYVVRVAGTVADPATVASVEFAAERLGAPLCVVLTPAGGTDFETLSGAGEQSVGFASLAARLRPALQRAAAEGLTGAAMLARAAEEQAQETVAECLRRSPVLRELVRLEHLRLLPAVYSLASGEVAFLTPRPPAELEAPQREPRPAAAAALPPHVALSLLQAGHRRFLAGTNGRADLSATRRQALVESQRPFALVLTDADARLAPEHLFDTGLGDLLVVRVAGCTLDDEVLGSLEHAARDGGAGVLLVLAPDRIGVAELLLQGEEAAARLSPSMRAVAAWLEPSALAARQRGLRGDALAAEVARDAVRRTVQQARARSKILRALEERGQLGILGAVYRLADGEIEWLQDARPAPAGPDQAAAAMPAAPAAEPAASAPGPAAAGVPTAGPPAAAPAAAPSASAPPPAAAPRRFGVASMLLINLLVLMAGAALAHVFLRLGRQQPPA
jgi:carbonic anhydrase